MNELVKSLNDYNTKVQEVFSLQAHINDLLIKSGYDLFRVQANFYVKRQNLWLDVTDPDTDKLYNFPIGKYTLDVLSRGLTQREVLDALIKTYSPSQRNLEVI